MSFDPTIIEAHAGELLAGLGMTLLLAVITIVISTPIALGLALARLCGGRALGVATACYVNLFRLVPVLTVLYVAFYGLPSFGIALRPFTAALGGLVAAATAYMCEDLRGAIAAVPSGQWQAARALGLGWWRIVWRVVLPQALPQMVPPYMSRVIIIVKSTALAGIVSVNELTGTTYALLASTYHATEFLAASAALYLAVNASLALLQLAIERHLARRF